MIKSDEIGDPTSCLNRSSSNEPLFVLCGRDVSAAHTVRMWADQYRQRKQESGMWTTQAQAKYAEAMGIADDMDLFPKGEQRRG